MLLRVQQHLPGTVLGRFHRFFVAGTSVGVGPPSYECCFQAACASRYGEPPFALALASTKVRHWVPLREPSVGVPAAPEESPDREVRIIFVLMCRSQLDWVYGWPGGLALAKANNHN